MRFRAVWPIVDLDRTRASLIEEALADLPDMLFEAGVAQAGPITWTTPSDHPDRVYLVAVLPVAPWVDPARSRRARLRVVGA